MKLKINHIAILVCVVFMHALGFLWYDALFGKQWMEYIGMDPAAMQAGEGPGASVWILNFVAAVAPLYVLAWLFTKLNVTSGMRGALIGFLITFSFHHLATMNGNMFAGEPYGLAWITGGYTMVCMTVSGFILGAWRKV